VLEVLLQPVFIVDRFLSSFCLTLGKCLGACSSICGRGAMLQARRSQVLVPLRSLNFVNLPNSSILYWCETWSLTVRKEHKLRVFENRV
jgi:hypothetical protein